MKIWLDTTNVNTVKTANKMGLLYGVTTNPALIAQSGEPMKKTLRLLLDAQDGPVTGQVIAHDVKGMVTEGKALHDVSDRIIVKVPVTQEGLEAMHLLSHKKIPVMATVVFHPYQALMAGLAGARYVAPYVSHIEKLGHNPLEFLQTMLTMYEKHEIETEILAASIKTIDQFTKCAEMGIPHITLKDDAFYQLIATDANTQERVNHFNSIWDQAKAEFI